MPTNFLGVDWLGGGFFKPKKDEEPAAPTGPQPFLREDAYASGQNIRPTLDPGSLRVGKSMDETLNNLLGQGTKYVNWLAEEEERRGAKAEGILGAAAERAAKPSMTDADIDRMFGADSDTAARAYTDNLRGLRSALGGAGVTGGGRAQGLAVGFEAQRQRILTDARRSLYEKRVQSDMMDRAARLQADMAHAAQVARDPSVAVIDWLGTAGGAILDKYGIDKQAAAAKSAAKASKQSGKMSGAGSIIGSIIPGL